jgi:RNA polymerase sigma-70 factor (ECF subfamily)
MGPERPEGSNPRAFGCVLAAWESHRGELHAYLRHRLDGADAAEDVLQDVFLKAVRQGRGFCVLENPRAWLFRVARNALVDRIRTEHAATPLPADLDELPAPEPTAPEAVDQLTGCLARCLAELNPDDAEILRACDLGKRTVREFAEAHGLGLAAAKSRLLRARRRLRERLTGACRVSFDDRGHVADHVPRDASR